jgi:hypothetical protein
MQSTLIGIVVSNPSTLNIFELFISSNFEISIPQYYTSDGRADVLDIVGHQKVRLSEVTVPDILDSDHIPVIFTILDPVGVLYIVTPDNK